MAQVRKIIRIMAGSGDLQGAYAFRIMKTAYDNQVKGECRYGLTDEFLITAEGEEQGVISFLACLNERIPGARIQIDPVEKFAGNIFSEFNLINTNYLKRNKL